MKSLLTILFISIFSLYGFTQTEYNATGSGGAYSLNYPASVSSLTSGLSFTFKANHTNTGAATLNVNGSGPIAIKTAVSSDLSANDILVGQVVTVVYDGTNFQMVSASGNGGASGSATYVEDTDADTYIDLESIADEDWIRMGTNGTQHMVIDNNGYVGIGIGSPSIGFHVGNQSRFDHALVNSTTVQVYNTNDGYPTSTTGTIGLVTGATSSGVEQVIGATIKAAGTGSGNHAGAIIEAQGNTTGTFNRGLIAMASNNANSNYGADIFANGNTGTNYGIRVNTGGTQALPKYGVYVNSSGSGTRYGVYTSGEDLNSFEGDVGIGTPTTSAKLDVDGDFNLRGQGVTPTASGPGDGKIYFDAGSGLFMVSENGGAWMPLVSVSGTSSSIEDLTTDTYINVDSDGTGTEDIIHFSTANSERMVIDNAGRVGINNSSPNNKLSIITEASDGFEMQTYGAGNTNMMSFLHYGGTVGSPSATVGGTSVGTLLYSGYGTSTDVAAAKITVKAETNFTDISSPSAIVLETTSSGNNFSTEKMRITSDGDVGIGSTNPAVKLDVNGDIGMSNDQQRLMRLDEGADLIPVAYGVINDGSIESSTSTSNFTVNKLGTGQYQITYTGPRTFGGLGEFLVTCTTYYQGTTLIPTYQYLGGTSFEIFLTDLSDVLTDGVVSFTLRVK